MSIRKELVEELADAITEVFFETHGLDNPWSKSKSPTGKLAKFGDTRAKTAPASFNKELNSIGAEVVELLRQEEKARIEAKYAEKIKEDLNKIKF